VSELGIPDKMHRLHAALEDAGIPHAFGGALALAWCVAEVRATMDIDLNVFIAADRFAEALEALPKGVTWTDGDVATLRRDGQARLAWGRHPVDVFFNTTPFHEQAATRVRAEPLAGVELPFLDCADLAVFKAFFNRPRDWLDLDLMFETESIDVARVLGILTEYLGGSDHRVTRLRGMAG
jgi:hypothetical protein